MIGWESKSHCYGCYKMLVNVKTCFHLGSTVMWERQEQAKLNHFNSSLLRLWCEAEKKAIYRDTISFSNKKQILVSIWWQETQAAHSKAQLSKPLQLLNYRSVVSVSKGKNKIHLENPRVKTYSSFVGNETSNSQELKYVSNRKKQEKETCSPMLWLH